MGNASKTYTLRNKKSVFSKARRKILGKMYLLGRSPDRKLDPPGKVREGYYYRKVENEEQLLAVQEEIASKISQSKFDSVYKRYMNDARKSVFYLFYNPDGVLIGYIELITEDFFDDSLNARIHVPASGVLGVDLYLFPEWQSHGRGRQLLLCALDACAEMGRETLLGLVDEDNPPSMLNAIKLNFDVWGCVYRLLPDKEKPGPCWYKPFINATENPICKP